MGGGQSAYASARPPAPRSQSERWRGWARMRKRHALANFDVARASTSSAPVTSIIFLITVSLPNAKLSWPAPLYTIIPRGLARDRGGPGMLVSNAMQCKHPGPCRTKPWIHLSMLPKVQARKHAAQQTHSHSHTHPLLLLHRLLYLMACAAGRWPMSLRGDGWAMPCHAMPRPEKGAGRQAWVANSIASSGSVQTCAILTSRSAVEQKLTCFNSPLGRDSSALPTSTGT